MLLQEGIKLVPSVSAIGLPGELGPRAGKLKPLGGNINPRSQSVRCMAHHSRLKQIWCGDGSGDVTIFNEQGELLMSCKCHDKGIFAMLASNWDDLVWTASDDQTVRVWTPQLACVKEFKPIQATSLCEVMDNIWIGTETDVWVIKRKSLKLVRKIKFPAELGIECITCLLFLKPFVWVGTNKLILRVDQQTEKVVDVLSGHSRIVHRMTWVPGTDGGEVWSCSSDRTVRVWPIEGGACKQVLSAHTGRVLDILVENSNKPHVWTCSWDGSILIWDFMVRSLSFHVHCYHGLTSNSLLSSSRSNS
jgi:WD40 repeat protein